MRSNGSRILPQGAGLNIKPGIFEQLLLQNSIPVRRKLLDNGGRLVHRIASGLFDFTGKLCFFNARNSAESQSIKCFHLTGSYQNIVSGLVVDNQFVVAVVYQSSCRVVDLPAQYIAGGGDFIGRVYYLDVEEPGYHNHCGEAKYSNKQVL